VAVEAAAPAEERIAKVIARAGIASRRDAEAMIAEGRVTLNGEPLASPAMNVGPDDRITIDGEPLPSRERTRLWLFHKPRGLVTTARDPEGRPTVFDSLPEDMPRVVAIGRLDINTEGLLLLTNDGGLAKVIAHPDTGWTRRYRARARGEVTQAELDKLKRGVTVDEMEYGPIDATLDRVQGDNVWITLALKEGKNREVKRVLEHVGLQVNRLIRLSFGPFQLGELEPGLVEEVRTRVLKDQLGQALAAEAGVDFESPVREPIAPFGKLDKAEQPKRGASERTPRPRTARFDDDRGERERRREFGDRERAPARGERPAAPRARPKPSTVWHAEAGDGEEAPRRAHPRREDPKAERQASAGRGRERVGAIASPEGRRVVVERLVADPDAKPRRPRRDDRAERPDRGERPARTDRPPPRTRRDDDDRPARPKRPAGAGFGRDREERGARPPGRSGPGRPAGGRPFGERGGRDGRDGPPRSGPRPGGRPGGKPGGRPGGPPRSRDR
jgi:23S rRNA pseudouridine2605 synthase